jgi:uncharacterized protein
MLRNVSLIIVFGLLALTAIPAADEPKPLKILFLGDDGHHEPSKRLRQIQPLLAKRGIDLQYID